MCRRECLERNTLPAHINQYSEYYVRHSEHTVPFFCLIGQFKYYKNYYADRKRILNPLQN